jgi:hypothetical protein
VAARSSGVRRVAAPAHAQLITLSTTSSISGSRPLAPVPRSKSSPRFPDLFAAAAHTRDDAVAPGGRRPRRDARRRALHPRRAPRRPPTAAPTAARAHPPPPPARPPAVDIDPSRCVQDFALYQWEVQRFGPIIVCSGGTVTFRWRALHGVFQIPTIACPSNFTAQEAGNYAFLSPVSQGGGYVWELPKDTGHYWATSQQGQDCYNGARARGRRF